MEVFLQLFGYSDLIPSLRPLQLTSDVLTAVINRGFAGPLISKEAVVSQSKASVITTL